MSRTRDAGLLAALVLFACGLLVTACGSSSPSVGKSLDVSGAQRGLDAMLNGNTGEGSAEDFGRVPACLLGDLPSILKAAELTSLFGEPYSTKVSVDSTKTYLDYRFSRNTEAGITAIGASCEADGIGEGLEGGFVNFSASQNADKVQASDDVHGPFDLREGKVYTTCKSGQLLNSENVITSCEAAWFPATERLAISAGCSWSGVTETDCKATLEAVLPLIVTGLASFGSN